MVTITRDNWHYLNGSKKPLVICPKCGGGLLTDDAPHGIRANGEVYRSVICPCGFHEHIKLQDWDGGEIAHK